MCGRYNFTDEQLDEIKQIIKEVIDRLYGKKVKTGDVYPTDLAAVLVWEENRISAKPVNWGFPKWNGKGSVINARAETALEKPMFREPLMAQSCVVPSTGYFEWKRVAGKKKKDKYHLLQPDKDILYMAGMIDSILTPDGGRYEAFTILTTEANESVSPLHNRMPVILQKDELESWLRDGVFMRIILERVCPALIMTLANEGTNVQISLF